MHKLNVLAVVVGVFLVALMIGRYWNLKPETKQSHVVHPGETAVVQTGGAPVVYVASTPELAYDLLAAAARGERAVIDKALAGNTAFALEGGAQVKITGESESKRRIVVTSGPNTGKTGWVEFESLRLFRPGEI
jgi:hypothetical protein